MWGPGLEVVLPLVGLTSFCLGTRLDLKHVWSVANYATLYLRLITRIKKTKIRQIKLGKV